MRAGKDYIGVGCGCLIINDNREVLLLKRGPSSNNEAGYRSQPGGKVEFGEVIQDAIKREIKEELGVDIVLLKFLATTEHMTQDQHWIAVSYLAKISGGTPKIMEPGKHDDIGWFELDRLPQPLTQPTIDSIASYQESL